MLLDYRCRSVDEHECIKNNFIRCLFDLYVPDCWSNGRLARAILSSICEQGRVQRKQNGGGGVKVLPVAAAVRGLTAARASSLGM